MAVFIDSPRFPDDVSYGSSGGPTYRTTTIELLSGHEQRNKEWAYPRHIYNVGWGARRNSQFGELIQWYHAVSGRLKGFRYKDWLDYNSKDFPAADGSDVIDDEDQLVKTADGVQTVFQLIKTYTVGTETQIRLITRPVSGTVVVAVDGTPASPTIDHSLGTLTFGVAPTNGQVITAGYEFDVPVRFENDVLDSAVESYDNIDTNIKVLEIREGPNAVL